MCVCMCVFVQNEQIGGSEWELRAVVGWHFTCGTWQSTGLGWHRHFQNWVVCACRSVPKLLLIPADRYRVEEGWCCRCCPTCLPILTLFRRLLLPRGDLVGQHYAVQLNCTQKPTRRCSADHVEVVVRFRRRIWVHGSVLIYIQYWLELLNIRYWSFNIQCQYEKCQYSIYWILNIVGNEASCRHVMASCHHVSPRH